MKVPVSVVITILNEQASILALLAGLDQQTLPPSEILIVDAGSSDGSVAEIARWQTAHSHVPIKVKILPGCNRSQGRNWAIQHAEHELIAITDAGCVPEPQWLEELVETAQVWQKRAEKKTERQPQARQNEIEWPVVAGFYRGVPQNAFEEAMVPYVLVPPHRVDPQNFLPASRSMLLPKKIWAELGGFPEKLIVSEDFVFARQIQAAHKPIVFAARAIVGWRPRATLFAFAKMIWSFAVSDAVHGAWRPQVFRLFLRYFVSLIFFLIFFKYVHITMFVLALLLFIMTYSVAAVLKNKVAVKRGWYWLPVLQFVADGVVMGGSSWGVLKKIWQGEQRDS